MRVLGRSGIHQLAISFRGCSPFTDVEANTLALALPTTLKEVCSPSSEQLISPSISLSHPTYLIWQVRLEFVESGATSEGGNAVLASVFVRIDLSHVR